MRLFKLTTFLLGLLILGCKQADSKNTLVTNENSLNAIDDKEQIKNLVRQVYKWHETQKYSEDDMVTDDKDSIYIGFNLDKLRSDLNELRKTNLFADEFIDNYNKIFLTINKKLKSKEFEWLVGELPPFGNEANPWCNCQDYPYDNPWDKIEFTFISLDNENATLTWTWGNSEWSKDFNYKVRATKTNGNWKISYLEGFDFDIFTRKNY